MKLETDRTSVIEVQVIFGKIQKHVGSIHHEFGK